MALSQILEIAAVVALLGAALCDVRSRRIPNAFPVALTAIWFAALLSGAVAAPGASAAAALGVFAAGFAGFAAGWIGGGDVKLAAAAALWVPPEALPAFLVGMSLVGGALALAMAAAHVARATAGGVGPRAALGGARRLEVPYGVAIAVAALAAMRLGA